jgi:N-acetylglucosamine kinase-like BadF-type ATPase
MRHILAVDGGGSKTDAVLLDETGTVLGWGRGGPVHGYYSTPDEVRASYSEAVSEALGERCPAALVVAGLPHSREIMALARCSAAQVENVPCGEVDTAFASVQREWGMVTLSGTGSFAYGRTPEGKSRHFGGTGPILGDHGSAYQIGLYGLRAAFSSRWTAARRTSLEAEVPKVYGLPDLRAVFDRVYGPGLSRREIAAVARVVDEQAEAGDAVALGCVIGAADELAALALDVINELDMRALAFPMIAIGSVAQKSRLWWERLCERVLAVAPQAEPIIPQVRPVIGAALLACKHLGVEWTPALLGRIVETQAPFLAGLETSAV